MSATKNRDSRAIVDGSQTMVLANTDAYAFTEFFYRVHLSYYLQLTPPFFAVGAKIRQIIAIFRPFLPLFASSAGSFRH